ncbi:hypothetical protein DYH10_01420 [Candidatus Saccharibacteria bacterium CPR2]|nr:hypothetical protein [Candidatus Saccharibacteria bacterium CPR2]
MNLVYSIVRMNLPNIKQLIQTDPSNPQAKKQKILMMVIGVLLVFAILFAILPMLSSGEGTKSNIQKAIAQQNEILRILKKFEKTPQTSKGQNFLREAQAILTSNSTQLEQYFQNEYQSKLDKKIQEKYLRQEVEDELSKASQTNAFDEKLFEQIKILLIENKDTLTEIYNSTKKDDLKQILEKIYESQDTLIKLAG